MADYIVKNNYALFWAGKLSQWYPAKIVINGESYCCNEQYMMACKALLFEDYETYRKIMNTQSPREQKALGRQVKYFDEGRWYKTGFFSGGNWYADKNGKPYAYQIVLRANLAKFSQHKTLKKLVFESGDLIFVEASPYDKIWGIGLDAKDPKAWDEATWQGKNWLGNCITLARDTLRTLEKPI